LDFGLGPGRFAAEIGGRLMGRRRVGHGQYERLLSGRLELPAQLAEPEQHGGLLLRTGGAGRVDHRCRQVRVHQFRVARRQSEYPCNDNEKYTVGVRESWWWWWWVGTSSKQKCFACFVNGVPSKRNSVRKRM